MKSRVPFVFACSVCIFVTTPAWPETYYVRNGGNDNADGLSDSTAWETLTHATQQLTSDDTLLLARGSTWIGTMESGGPQGLIYLEDKSNVTVDAYGSGTKPIIDRRNDVYTGTNHRSPDYTCIEIQGTFSDTLVANLQLMGGKDTAAMLVNGSGTNIRISDVEFQGAGYAAESLLIANSARIIVENCFFDAITGNTTTYSKSIEMRYADGNIIRHNVFRGFTTGGAVRFSNQANGGLIEGNYFYDPDFRDIGAWAIVVRSQDGGTVVIRNNVIDLTNNGNLSGSNLRGMAFWGDTSGTEVTRKIINNTIVSDGVGYGIHGGGWDVIVSNNIFYGLQLGYNNASTSADLINNIFHLCNNRFDPTEPPGSEAGSIEADPLLVDATMSNRIAADASIQSNSPAIDAGDGTDPDTPTTDFFSNARTGPVDIGAIEYGGTTDTIPPMPPSGLSVQ